MERDNILQSNYINIMMHISGVLVWCVNLNFKEQMTVLMLLI